MAAFLYERTVDHLETTSAHALVSKVSEPYNYD